MDKPETAKLCMNGRSLGATLVTNNERHFRRVSGLRVENWAR